MTIQVIETDGSVIEIAVGAALSVVEIAVGVVGPRGLQGVAGTPGSVGPVATTFDFDQLMPSATWVINHGLGKFPSVTVVDSAGSVCEGGITYGSQNQVTLTFSVAFSGHAYLN